MTFFLNVGISSPLTQKQYTRRTDLSGGCKITLMQNHMNFISSTGSSYPSFPGKATGQPPLA